MERLRAAVGSSGAVAVIVLLMAPSAFARHVDVHVALKDSSGYRMSIEASRRAGQVFGIASRKVAGAAEPAPLRALSRNQVSDAARAARAGGGGHRASSGFLSVQVQNDHAISTYGVDGTVTHNRLYGKLGDFGRISLHFHLRKVRKHRHGCRNGHERIGRFTGHVRFHGEDGYVDVDAHKLKGRVELPARQRFACLVRVLPPRPATARSKRPTVDRYSLLFAEREFDSGETYFAAFKEAREHAVFASATFEQQGRVTIDREEYSEGKPGDFKVSKRVTSARVRPSPAAYRGTGHFRARHHWTGSLATSFPGAPSFHLAGRGFRAKLRQFQY
jgi:hypothetical protein